jgi:hypothetical protein
MPSARSGRSIVRVDTSAEQKGIIDFGQSLAKVGAAVADYSSSTDLFDAEKRFQEFKWGEQQGLEQSLREVEPGQADGLADNWATGYKQKAREFLSTVPESQKSRYDNKLFGAEREFYGRASTFARTEQKRAAEASIDDAKQNQYFSRARSGEELSKIGEDYKSLVSANPFLTPIEKDEIYRGGFGDLEEAHIAGRVDRGEDIETILSDIRGRTREEKPAGLLQSGNVNLNNRPRVKNADGSISTVRSMSVNFDGKEVLIPTVSDDGKILSEDDAVEQYKKTGKYLGMFDTPENATAYAERLHKDQERQYANPDAARANISVQLETGKTDPLEGVANISADSAGSRSYGNFGLNSGGSAQKFAAEYGKQFGLTAKPGTRAFDEQWTNAAKSAPVELHDAEMRWYSANITPELSSKLTKAGVSADVANDPRVQAYFADRSIQQGEGSIDRMAKHKARINAAFAASNGDPVAFLNNITEADREELESDFPTALRTGVYSERGHDARLNGRLKLALGVDGSGAELPSYDGPYRNLSPKRRLELENKIKIASSEVTQQALKDGEAEIRRTGQAPVDVDGRTALDRAKRFLTKNQVEKAKIDWQEASLEHRALSDLDTLPEVDLQDRLAAIEPKPGEALYEIKTKVFDKATKRVENLRKERDTDPAQSVVGLPEVDEAIQAVRATPDDPEALQNLSRVRLDAQAKVGIPEGLRSPVTRAEARVLMSPVRGLEGKALTEALVPMQATLQERYGPYARSVGIAALETAVKDKDLADQIQYAIDNAFKGQPVLSTDVRRIEYLTEINAATRAFGGEFVGEPFRKFGPQPTGQSGGVGPLLGGDASFRRPETQTEGAMPYSESPMGGAAAPAPAKVPPARAIAYLMENPATVDRFEELYGKGSAAQYLSPAPEQNTKPKAK